MTTSLRGKHPPQYSPETEEIPRAKAFGMTQPVISNEVTRILLILGKLKESLVDKLEKGGPSNDCHFEGA
ncbi:MAG: hypothetical protein C0189_03170 [Caldisericum exile]|uniref:Uncharacterized protein n=1 Tax=Caldisericum exile TaxID=693075 RepID=A0A2J6WEE6_9BACT|nr:MAG: hypothetical protein C0189_03170 [Caldisericum exile]